MPEIDLPPRIRTGPVCAFSRANDAIRTVAAAVLLTGLLVAGCTPTVRVEAPEKPIEINLNVKIEHEIRVKVDQELDEIFEEDSTLF